MRIKATIVAYAFSVQCFENATIVAYAGLRVNNLAILSTTLILLQTITSLNNSPVHKRVYGYLRLSFINACVSYVFSILPVAFPLYLLVTT